MTDHQDERPERPSGTRESGHGLDDLRRRIDELDARLIELLSERARVVVEVGERKRSDGTPIYAPHREKAVLDKVVHGNPGPLPDRTVEAIWRELMSGSFRLERPLRIAYLGPPGSFSHAAAVTHFGSSVELVDLREIDLVFEEVAARRVDYGVVPYENSIGGSITDTLDAFPRHEVAVYAESMVEVNQAFLVNGPIDEIREIRSKPQAFSQCRRWLARRFPNVPLVSAPSTSAAVAAAAEDPSIAAVGSPFAGELYGVNVAYDRISDVASNVTRFLVIARQEARPSGEDRTTIMFTTAHRPGALVDVLAAFRDAGVNLSHIEKRPSQHENWQYTFFVDAEGHHEDATLERAIADARTHCESLRVLGSYPRAQRVL